jgi:hypothetical protein
VVTELLLYYCNDLGSSNRISLFNSPVSRVRRSVRLGVTVELGSNLWRGRVRRVRRCALQSSFGVMTLLAVLQTVQSYASSGTAAGSDKKIDGNYTVLAINKVKILSLQTRGGSLAVGELRI